MGETHVVEAGEVILAAEAGMSGNARYGRMIFDDDVPAFHAAKDAAKRAFGKALLHALREPASAEASGGQPRLTRAVVAGFVRAYIANEQHPTQDGALQEWKHAGHGSKRRQQVREIFDAQIGNRKPQVGRPRRNSQKK